MNGWVVELAVIGGIVTATVIGLLLASLLSPSPWTIHCGDCAHVIRPRRFLPWWTKRARIYAHRVATHRDFPPLYVNPTLRQEHSS